MPGNRLTGVYLGSFHFKVIIDGITANDGFLKVTPLVSETEVMTFKHGMDRVVRKAMGRTVFNAISLERVYSGLDEFSRWRDKIVSGIDDRRTVQIFYMAPNGTTVIRQYDCYNAWPSKWELPEMDGGSSNLAIEKIELQVERVRLISGQGPRTDVTGTVGG